MDHPEQIRVLLVDDHTLMREGLRHIISQHQSITVVGEANNGHQALAQVAALQPDVVLMDISMPDMNGIEATRRILDSNEHASVVALSIHTDRQFVLEAMRAGVVGFLPKNCSAQALFDAIVAASQGRTYFADPQWAEYASELQEEAEPPVGRESILTGREREILQLLAEGNNTKEIAFALAISVKTVEFHRQQLMKKLDIYNVAELTKYAVREGLTTL